MRFLLAASVVLAIAQLPAVAAADVVASGAVGGGLFDTEPLAQLDAGIDFGGEKYAAGFGVRLRFLADEGLRKRDWDEPSELARFIRYAVYRHDPPDRVGFSAALGELGGAHLGHSTVVSGFGTGIRVDHGRVGGQMRLETSMGGVEFLIDDVVSPRILGGRGRFEMIPGFAIGATMVSDLRAPRANGTSPATVAAAEIEYGTETEGGGVAGAIYSDAVAVWGEGAGLHVGGRSDIRVRDRLYAKLRAEVHVGSSGYVPGWFGPLYEVERRTRLGEMKSDAGGVGATGEIGLEIIDGGEFTATYTTRQAAPDLAVWRLTLPSFRAAQFGFWAALSHQRSDIVDAALVAELRARLPGRFYVTAEAARLYRDVDESLVPFWSVTAALGAVFGEEHY